MAEVKDCLYKPVPECSRAMCMAIARRLCALCVCLRERETERDQKRDRERYTDTHTYTGRETLRNRQGETERDRSCVSRCSSLSFLCLFLSFLFSLFGRFHAYFLSLLRHPEDGHDIILTPPVASPAHAHPGRPCSHLHRHLHRHTHVNDGGTCASIMRSLGLGFSPGLGGHAAMESS